MENLLLKTTKIAPFWKGLMLNDDDFPALPNSTGQNSQQQVHFLQINHLNHFQNHQKGLSGTTSGNDELKRRHRLAIEGNEKAGIQTHHDGKIL